MVNISKKKLFPENYYDIYHMTSEQVGDYLNTWFYGKKLFSNKKIGKFLIKENIYTVKEVDHNTMLHLYHKRYNPVSITISAIYNRGKYKMAPSGEIVYDMMATIHSIDDSSYTIFFDEASIEELKEKRKLIMESIETMKVLNGNEFIGACIKIGGNPDKVNYD